MPIFKRLLRYALVLALAGIVLAVAAFGVAYWLISPRLPPVKTLKNVQMQVPLRVYSADGKLLASFGEMHRTPVNIKNVPTRLQHAVLAAEDADFYHHGGVDWEGTFRAGLHVILAGGKKVQGGSTITQQVARNFFLSSQKTYTRKLEEMFLSFRIENALSKDQILELYLNKMFMGHRAYGVAAAAQYYYGKTLDQLTIAQCAMLGGLYQAPSAANPVSNPKRALRRRNYVLRQMRSNNFINPAQFKQAVAEPVTASPHEPPVKVHAPYVAEMVRQAALERLGNAALSDGYVIHTTIDSKDQAAAEHALRWGLEKYDRRHGYRGPEAHVQLPPQAGPADFDKALSGHDAVAGIQPGLVTHSSADKASVYLKSGKDITLTMDAVKWARPYVNATYPGKAPGSVDAVIKRGDIVRVMHPEKDSKDENAKEQKENTSKPGDEATWMLAQIPAVNGALVSLRPEDGSVRALIGGFSFQRSKFNRALMSGSGRQPGSSFKPYIYTAALNHGFTNASIINDAPVVLPDPSKPHGRWTPQNDDGKFDGPIRLRTALIESKNLVSVRLLDAVGLRYARHYITRFGFSLDQLPNNLTMALGTASVSPMSMARGYAVFANGGFRVDPYFISEIDNRNGQALYKADPLRACRNCQTRQLQDPEQLDLDTDAPPAAASSATDPLALNSVLQPVAAASSAVADAPAAATSAADAKPRLAPRVITPRNDFLITSLMKGVIRHGTGHAAMALGREDLAGKTGTTNDQRDAWFDGFNANMLTIVWVGFDDFGTLGHHEFGATAALPIWMKYMGSVLKGKPEATLPMPPGITKLLINKNTGLPTSSNDPDAMQEYFKVENVDKLRQAAQQRKQDKAQQNAYDIF